MNREKQEYTIDDIEKAIEFFERQFDTRSGWSEQCNIPGFKDKNKKYANFYELAVLSLKVLLIMQGQEIHEFDDVERIGTFTPNKEMSECLTELFGEITLAESEAREE